MMSHVDTKKQLYTKDCVHDLHDNTLIFLGLPSGQNTTARIPGELPEKNRTVNIWQKKIMVLFSTKSTQNLLRKPRTEFKFEFLLASFLFK